MAMASMRTIVPAAAGLLLIAVASAASPDGAPPDTAHVAAPDVEPALVEFADAVYPPAALQAGREGTVLLELLVNAAGAVDSVSVVASLDPELDQAAADAARRCRFSPAMAAGEPVPVYVQFAYTFSVREQTLAVAPRINLQGRVLEMGTRAPVGGAMVVATFPAPDTGALAVPWRAYLERIGGFAGQYLEVDRLVTFADEEGRFVFRALPPGPVALAFPNAGYEPLTAAEEIRAGELVDAVFRLRRSRYNEYEVVVYGRQEEKEVSRQRLSVLEVERLPGFAGDVIKSVQALPGVARATIHDPGAVVVRGSGNFDSRFFLDGIDVPLLFHFGGAKSTYNSLALASVDLYPGGFGTQYGGCTGGVIELKGRPARRDRWHAVVDASTLDVSFLVEGPLGRYVGLLVTGRRSYIGDLAKAALSESDDVSLNVAPYYWDLVSRLDWGAGTNNHVFLTAFAAKDRLDMVVPDDASGSPEVSAATDQIELDLSFSRFILGWDARLGDRVRNELRAAYGRSADSGHVLGEFRFAGKGPVWHLRNDLAVAVEPRVTPHIGIDLGYLDYAYEVKANGWPASRQAIEFSDVGAYANVELRPRPNMLLVPGVRRDYYHHLDEAVWSARGSLRWNYLPDRTLTAAYGTYNQMPEPAGQSTDAVYGNPDLPATRARHATLGHEWRLSDRVFLKVEGYRNRQDRIPAYADTLGANFLPDQEARMYGVEVMLRREAGGCFFGWIAYSIGRSERRFARNPGRGDDWRPDQWQLYDLDQSHHLEAVGSWNLGRNWSFGTRLQTVSGVPRTPILGYTGNRYEFDADRGDYVPVEGRYLADRVEPYVRVDLRFDKKWIKDRSVWSVYLDLQNANFFVYNSPEGYVYNYDYSKRKDYGWIFMPAVGVRAEF